MTPHSTSNGDTKSLPKRCVSCVSWGHGDLPGDDAKWRWCSKNQPSYAHVDYVCGDYERLPKDHAYARLNRWGVAYVEQPKDDVPKPAGGVYAKPTVYGHLFVPREI